MLNAQQQKFVDSDSNFIRCIAPAGSGKTHSMVSKIERLADMRIHPRNILAITFTRAAGINLRERCEKVIGADAKEMFCNTFHAFAIKVIKENARMVSPIWEDYEIINGKIDFTIYDQLDRDDIVKSLIKKYELKNTNPKNVTKYIFGELKESDKQYKDSKFIADEYKRFCIENVALDLNDLINIATDLLKIESVKTLYDYEAVFVDEYQDTNDTQNELLKALNPKKLFIVGDPRQSIYGFNRAKVEYILNFHKWWSEVETIKLQDNYRCTSEIVSFGENIISLDDTMPEMNVVAHKSGEHPAFYVGNKLDDEAHFIYQSIINKDSNFKDHAVLCRTNAIALSISEYLEMKCIPVNLVSSADDPLKKDYVRSVIKLLQFCVNEQDVFSFQKSVNFPNRRMTDFEISNAINKSILEETSILEFAKEFKNVVRDIQSVFDQDCDKVFNYALYACGVMQEYTLKRLQSRMTTFEEVNEIIIKWRIKSRDKSIGAFIKWLSIKDIQEKTLEEKDAVTICTCHGAKGLEWPHVYIAGVSEGIFPSERETTDINEELRLMHVAITRAEETLTITSSKFYTTPFGQVFNSGPSRFFNFLQQGL